MVDAFATGNSTLVVQHNALVNARFDFSALETRLFLLMLSRIKRADQKLPVSRIAVRDLVPDATSHSRYGEVRTAVQQLLTRTIVLEQVGADGQRLAQPELVGWPLLGQARYLPAQGQVEVVFNDHLRPYLLELTGNFTRAQLQQLLALKSPVSHRIYWLLKEYVTFGQRTITVQKLRELLGYTTEYANRFDRFRERVLDRAQQELAQTDLPFTYELVKQGCTVTAIHFQFMPAQLPAAPAARAKWETLLLAVGVSPASLVPIRQQLASGVYEEGYIPYVVTEMKQRVRLGKVKKLAGAVYDNLTRCYLLPAYKQAVSQPSPALSVATLSPAKLVEQRQRLHNALDDAQNTLRFVRSPAHQATPAERATAVRELETKIAHLTAQLDK